MNNVNDKRQAIVVFAVMIGLWAFVGSIEKCDEQSARQHVYEAEEEVWGWEPR